MEAELPKVPRRARCVEQAFGPACQMFAGHLVLAGHLECQRGQADKQSCILGQVEGAWLGKKEVERRRLGGTGLPLDRGSREVGSSGPVAGSDLRPKQTCLRGLGAAPSLPRWNQRQTGTLEGPAVTPAPHTQRGPLTPSSP